ncbi:MAG: ribonuclease H-like domain-containing protein [Anaerovoracaceae bacterium]
MKIIEYRHNLEHFSSGLMERYFEGMSFCVFDIETLGLNPAFCPVVLAGVMTAESDGSFLLTQYFAETPDDEKELLVILEDYLNRFDCILTYNGRHFDVPFIKKRAARCGLNNFSVKPYNLDLYLIVNGHSPFRHTLKSLSQSSVEEYMGLSTGRLDEISGKESVELYYKYLDCTDPTLKASLMDKILLHNHDDLVQLYRILPVIRQTDMHSAMYSLGFPVKGQNCWPNMNISKIKLTSRNLIISGIIPERCCAYTCFASPLQPYEMNISDEGEFELAVTVEKYKGNLFVNIRELLSDTSSLEMLGGHVNGFLILCSENKRNPLEINMLARELLLEFMGEMTYI